MSLFFVNLSEHDINAKRINENMLAKRHVFINFLCNVCKNLCGCVLIYVHFFTRVGAVKLLQYVIVNLNLKVFYTLCKILIRDSRVHAYDKCLFYL